MLDGCWNARLPEGGGSIGLGAVLGVARHGPSARPRFPGRAWTTARRLGVRLRLLVCATRPERALGRKALHRTSIRLSLATGALMLAPLFAQLASASGPGSPALVSGGGTHLVVSSATGLVLDCDLRNYGVFTPAPGSAVVLRGFGSPLLLGVDTFANLSIFLQGEAALANSATIGGRLLLNRGRLSLAGHDLVADTILGGTSVTYVVTPDTMGRLVRTVGAGADVWFPIGNTSFNPVSIRTSTGTDVFRVAVLDNPATTGLDAQTALTRAWAVSHPNPPGVNGPLTMAVLWNMNEYGPGFDRSLGQPTSAWAWRWVNGAWAPQPNVRRWTGGGFPAIDSLVTADAGLWTLAGVSQLLSTEPPAAAPRVVELAPAFPNPSRGSVNLRFGLPTSGHVTLALYSVLGERVATLADGERAAGWHLVRLDDGRLPAGIYFVRLQAGRDVRNSKLVVTR